MAKTRKYVIATGASTVSSAGQPAGGERRRPARCPTTRRRRRSSSGAGSSAHSPRSITGPRLRGRALYAASWASPTVSKTSPTSHTSDADHSDRPPAHRRRRRPTCTGSETNQIADALDEEHLAHRDREADLAPARRASPRSAGPRRGRRRRRRMCQARRQPHSRDQHRAAATRRTVAVADARPPTRRRPRRSRGPRRRRRPRPGRRAARPAPSRSSRPPRSASADGQDAGRHHGRVTRHRTAGSVVRPPGRTSRIWSTPIRPSRKAIAPPTR